MKTVQIITRPLLGSEVRQNHKTQALCATDLVKIGNKLRISRGEEPFDLTQYFIRQGTKEFMAEIEAKYGWAKYAIRGKGATTWVHPILFIDIALSVSPALKLEVYEWIMDSLCELRDQSGDSFKHMCGVLWARETNKQKFPDYIKDVCRRIKETCRVEDWNIADTKQLALREAIHNDIIWLGEELKDGERAVQMALRKNSNSH